MSVTIIICHVKGCTGDISIVITEVNLKNVSRGNRVRRQGKDGLWRGQIDGPGLGVDAVARAIRQALAHIRARQTVCIAGVHTIVECCNIPVLDLAIDRIALNQEEVLHPTGTCTRGIECIELHSESSIRG